MEQVRKYGKEPYTAAVLHGGPGAPGSMAAVARELSSSCGVLEPLQSALTVAAQIEELHETLLRHGHGPVVLIGHSWGAWLACLYAAQYPAEASRLILVGSGPFREEDTRGLHRTRMSRLNGPEQEEFAELLQLLKGASAEAASAYLARLGALVSQSDDYEPMVVPGEREDRIPADGRAYDAVWEEAAAMRRSGELLKRVSRIVCPVTAIHGDYDPHPAAGVREPLQDAGLSFRFHLLERCGHTPWKEQHAAEEFYRIIRSELL